MTTITLRSIKVDSVRTGIILMCMVSFIWGLMEVIVQYIPGGYSVYQIVWVRYATHLLFMLVMFAPRHGIELISTQRVGLQFLRAIMMLIMPVSFVLATEYLPVGNILTLFWLCPLMIMGLSIPLLKERVSWHYWVIASVGLICTAILVHPNLSVSTMGVILSLAMGLSFSLYIVLTRVLRDESTLANLFYTAVGVLIPLSVGLPAFWKPLTLQSGLMIALVGLLGFGLLWILDKVMDLTSVAVTAPFLYSQMFWIVVFRLILRIL
jgi:drug/metabolite transporter (DMT)-like permease